ncbi:MAG: GTPase HflX [Actinobacteria bacterium]|nr:MAG: GTPase HflX [Actinomycetota bacterium]
MSDGAEGSWKTHRGGFGEYGGQQRAFIERAFREKIVIVGVALNGAPGDADASLDELSLLIDSAGADEVGRIVLYVGRGKAAEIKDLAEETDCDTVVFDDELSPAQLLNLERLLGRTAIDRTAVILDIFAQNAHTLEGKAQVELAQLRYRLPRLRGRGGALSQQAGGIGTRGPGETQLEVDRRRIERRIHKLEAQLRAIARHRDVQAKARRGSPVPEVAIVGYTNAGKSTLLNRITDARALVANRLFATLDPTTRRRELAGGEAVLFTDTVGFVAKLPHQLVEAFKSTLEVVVDADLLIHVVDSSAPEPQAQIEAVHGVLGEIGASDVAEVLAFNKADLSRDAERLAEKYPVAVAVSARTGTGVGELLELVAQKLHESAAEIELLVPFDRGDLLAGLHRDGRVLCEEPREDGVLVRVLLARHLAERMSEFVVGTLEGQPGEER